MSPLSKLDQKTHFNITYCHPTYNILGPMELTAAIPAIAASQQVWITKYLIGNFPYYKLNCSPSFLTNLPYYTKKFCPPSSDTYTTCLEWQTHGLHFSSCCGHPTGVNYKTTNLKLFMLHILYLSPHSRWGTYMGQPFNCFLTSGFP